MQTAMSSDLIEDITDLALRILFAYCIPYAVKDTGEMFGCWDEDKMDLSVYNHDATWVISSQDVRWFVDEMKENDQEVLKGYFFNDKILFGNGYFVTKYGNVRVISQKEFSLHFRLQINRRGGLKWFNPEFLVESYKRKDVLFYIPETKIKNMEYWTEQKEALRLEKENKKRLRVELIGTRRLSEDQTKILKKVLDFDTLYQAHHDPEYRATYKAYEQNLRKELRDSALGEEILDRFIQMH